MYGKLALCFIGLSSGGVIAAGIFAFLAIIGVFPRLIGVTHTRCHVILYETLLILGERPGTLWTCSICPWQEPELRSWPCGDWPWECSWGAW